MSIAQRTAPLSGARDSLSGLAAFAALAIVMLPAAASADLYYYAPNTTSGAFNYGSSFIPSAAMPYVAYGQAIAQQYEQQYGGYSYPYGYQSQYQYQSSYPNYDYGYSSYPDYGYGSSYSYPGYGYAGTPSYGYSYGYNSMPGYYSSQPQSYSYPSGTYDPFGTQQWGQGPYTGMWY